MKLYTYLLILALLACLSYTKTAEEWKDRVIYEILTDRFYNSIDPTYECPSLSKYCGGTFKGIEQNLDYLVDLGINAIWISPIQPNTEDGYHGYWPIDFYGINPHFGTEQDFIDLVKACHERDIWIMLDIVVNHVGYVQPLDNIKDTEKNDYSNVKPFNNLKYFNKYEFECKEIEAAGRNDPRTMETCWLFWLPDLNQEDPETRKLLLDWAKWLVTTYQIDGLRLDALRHVPKDFWKDLNEASGVYTLGEAWHPDIGYNADYQKYVDSLLNFPLQELLTDCLTKDKSMSALSDFYKEATVSFPDITVIANFLDCHDKSRFLFSQSDPNAYKTALVFIMSVVGIPTIYYGNEQNFIGGKEADDNRETFWGHFNKDADTYKLITQVLKFRKITKFYEMKQVERLADQNIFAFTRGPYFFVFTNSPEVQSRTIDNHDYIEGTILCNLFDNNDCVEVKNKKFEVKIASKDSKILIPKIKDDKDDNGLKIWESIKQFCNIANLDQTSF